MNSFYWKIFAILIIFIGEALAIYAELLMAKNNFATANFLRLVIMITVGGILLLFGYKVGFDNFKNIWIVAVASITSILIIEPILAYSIFKQVPTRGAIIGLIFGAIGFAFSIFD